MPIRSNRKSSKPNRRKRLLELSLEVAIGVAIVIGVLLYAEYGPDKSPIDGKWIIFGLNTAFVFGWVIKLTRPFWKEARLWTTLACLLMAHGVAGWLVLRPIERVGTVWYVPVVVAEIALFHAVVERVLSADAERPAP